MTPNEMLTPEIINKVRALCKSGLDINHPRPLVIPPLPGEGWTLDKQHEHIRLNERIVRAAAQQLKAAGEIETGDGVHFRLVKKPHAVRP